VGNHKDFSRVYKGASNSLNVNENFGDHAQADGLVYNEVPYPRAELCHGHRRRSAESGEAIEDGGAHL